MLWMLWILWFEYMYSEYFEYSDLWLFSTSSTVILWILWTLWVLWNFESLNTWILWMLWILTLNTLNTFVMNNLITANTLNTFDTNILGYLTILNVPSILSTSRSPNIRSFQVTLYAVTWHRLDSETFLVETGDARTKWAESSSRPASGKLIVILSWIFIIVCCRMYQKSISPEQTRLQHSPTRNDII